VLFWNGTPIRVSGSRWAAAGAGVQLSAPVEAFAEHNLVAARAETTCPAAAAQFALTTAGIFQVPSMMDGGFSRGQYIRSIRTNLSFGAGSQFASLALPGDWF
jgi:hypothetical protein